MFILHHVVVAFSDFSCLIFSAAEAMTRVPGMAWSVFLLSSADAMLGRVSSAAACHGLCHGHDIWNARRPPSPWCRCCGTWTATATAWSTSRKRFASCAYGP